MRTTQPGCRWREPEPRVAPYGSWRSPIDVELVAGTAVTLSEPWLDGDDAYWLETRVRAGRSADAAPSRPRRGHAGADARPVQRPQPRPRVRRRLVRGRSAAGSSPRGRTTACGGWTRRASPRPVALTPDGPWRYADLWFDPPLPSVCSPSARPTTPTARTTRPWSRTRSSRSPSTGRMGRAASSSSGRGLRGRRPSLTRRADARWLEWDHPGHALGRGPAAGGGDLATTAHPACARTLAGGPGVSIEGAALEPGRGPALRVRRDRLVEPVRVRWRRTGSTGRPATSRRWTRSCGDPPGPSGARRTRSSPTARSWRSRAPTGATGLLRIEPDGTRRRRLETAFTEVEGAARGRWRGAGRGVRAARRRRCSLRLDPATGEPTGVLARGLTASLDPGVLAEAEPITLPDDGRRHGAGAATSRPSNAAYRAPDGELPPLLVLSHGGPTSAASSALSLDRAFFTSRGIAVVDVDYRGSTGYGRPYRDALKGEWGIADVDDCVAAARFLVERGSVDPRPHGRSAAEAPAATRPSPRSRSGRRCSRRGSATSGSRTWS